MNGRFEEQVTVRQFIEALPDAMVVVNRDGHIVLTNTRAEQLFGFAGGELVGRSVESLLPPRLRERHNGHRLSYFSEPYVGRMGAARGLDGLRSDGTRLAVDIHLSCIETDSGLFAAVMVCPVNEDRQHDAALQGDGQHTGFARKQKSDAVDRLIGGMAHEFNNILSVVSGYSQLLLKKLPPGDSLSAQVAEIHKAAQRAAALTHHLLAFNQQQMLHPTLLNLNGVVADTEKLKRLVGGEIDLVTRLSPDLALVKADPEPLDQVMQALVRNACEAMPQGGTLTIEIANIDLPTARLGLPATVPAGQYVTLAIKDTGHGIDPEIQPRIFEPFFTTKPLRQGVGLDLASAYGFVAQSGGSLTVDSEPGLGATFTIYLPRVVAAPGAVGSDMARLPSQTGPTAILLAEDEDAVRGLVSSMLQSAGYEVFEASSGHEALRMSRSRPDLIPLLITDVMMPGMNGTALAEILMRERHGMKVLFISGFGGDAVIRDDLRSPRIAFLRKPFSEEVLLREVRKLMERPTVL